MSIGIALPASPSDVAASRNAVDFLVDQARRAAAVGVERIWFSQRLDVDAVTVAAIVGREVPGVALGTSVVPIYPRHPLVLASQAQTAQAATGGRFTLGLGLSGKMAVERRFGVPYDRPIRHLRDYLTTLHAVFGSGEVSLHGPTLVADTQGQAGARVPGAQPPPIIVAAMGPQALRVTGELADGTLPYLAGPRTLANHIVPSITRAASAAGRRPPRIVAALPAVVTSDAEAVRARAAVELAFYATIPSYQAVLTREGVAHPVELAAIGDEAAVAAELRRYLDAGATELLVTNTSLSTPEDQQRTWALLAELSRAAARPGH